MQNELNRLIEWHRAGHGTALALVLKTWGSAPRAAGSLMAVRADGTFEGSVSGGCVEGAVIAQAQALAGTKGVKRLSFRVAEHEAWAVGLACGGEIEVAVIGLAADALPALRAACAALEARRPGLLNLELAGGAVRFDSPGTLPAGPGLQGDTFLLPVRPKPRLAIVGAVHIAQALAPMAIACGYDVTVIDPRGAFTDNRDFGGANTVGDWPDDYFRALPPDAETAVVALTHDPKLDDPAIRAALACPAFYIGALGSRKTHASRLDRLAGLPGLDRIHGPIGLDIGARTPAEIAVAILAQVTLSRRKRDEV